MSRTVATLARRSRLSSEQIFVQLWLQRRTSQIFCKPRRIMFTLIVAAHDSANLGVCLGFSSSVSAQLLLGDYLLSFFTSIINLGALAGCLVVAPLLTNWGRRNALRIGATVSIFSWILIACAQGLTPPVIILSPTLLAALLIGRVLSGLSVGMLVSVASVYLVEIAPPSQSGRYGSLAQCAIVAGTCIAYYCGMVVVWYQTARYMVVASIVLFAATFYLPESPVWLMKQSSRSMEEAVEELTWLRGNSKLALQELNRVSLQSPSHSAQSPQGDPVTSYPPSSSVVSILFPCTTIPPEYLPSLRIAITLMIAQQCTGINVVTFFTEPICREIVNVSRAPKCAFVLGLAQLGFTLLTSLFMDRFPRRQLFCTMGVLMAVSMFFFAIGQKFPTTTPVPPLVALVCFLFGYQCGWGPLAMLITMELFPVSQRGAAGGAAVAVSWIVSFCVTQTFKPMVHLLGGTGNGDVCVFLAYAVITLSMTLGFFYRHLPETNQAFAFVTLQRHVLPVSRETK